MRISLSLTSSPSSPRVPMTINPNTTTTSSLHSLASEASCIPREKIKMIFRGRLIPKDGDANVVEGYLLEDGCVVHCMGKPQISSAQPQQTPASHSSESSAAASASAAAPSVVRPPPNAAAAAVPAATTVINAAGGHPLTVALETIKSNHDANTYSTGVATLLKLLDNIISHPSEDKYRKVKRSNPAFQKRLGSLSGSVPAMASIGFTVQQQGTSTSTATGEYILIASAEAWPKLLECQKILKDANAEAQRSRSTGSLGGGGTSATNASTPGMNTPTPFGTGTTGIPNLNMPGMPGAMAGGPAGMADALLQNPSQLRSLLQNPMVRRMMENNPNIANNPMAQQSLDMMQQNPQMLEQAIQMMNGNPELRRSLIDNVSSGAGGVAPGTGPGANFDAETMRRQMSMMQALSGNMGAMPSSTQANNASGTGQVGGSANQNTGTTAGGSGGGGDAEMTEEEMIAEAIARSLRDS